MLAEEKSFLRNFSQVNLEHQLSIEALFDFL